jgi:tRNA pseudouridine38-40 synthase
VIVRLWFKLNWSSKFVLLVAYDGTQYHGFQWQAGLPTIQDELERAIARYCGQSSRVMAASRTDAGVHAVGQVVSFWAKATLNTATMVRALNHYLPIDIAVRAAHRAGEGFSVRRDALSREYHYRLLNSGTRSPFSRKYAFFMPRALNIEVMDEACRLIHGEHDFASFASALDDDRSTVRIVHEADVRKEGEFTVFRVVANSFLPHQVRSTVGMLIRVGRGKLSVEGFRDIMDARTPGLAGPLSSPCGLWLMNVRYATCLGS